MSNALSIAAVTAALRNRLTDALGLDPALSGLNVRTRPMDHAFDPTSPDDSSSGNCLNIFLYHVVPSPAFRNRAMAVQPGETGSPPLALNLHYLISAYGDGGDDVLAHRILGAAMACLHDHPLLTPTELKALTGADLHLQADRVRIREQALTTEEMYKLWSAFQTQYRVSAAYEVSAVLIESARPIKAALPALRVTTPSAPATVHAPQPVVVPRIDLASPYPLLEAVAPPGGRDHAEIGEVLTLSGDHLTDVPDTALKALLSHPILPAIVRLDVPIPPPADPPDPLTVTIPSTYTPPGGAAFNLPAGVYTVSLEVAVPGKAVLVTNELPLRVAPRITASPTGPVSLGIHGEAEIELTVSPSVWPGQRVYILLGAQGFPLRPPLAVESSDLAPSVPVAPGEYPIRVRVDGVDSPLLDPATMTFSLAPRVTIEP